MLSFKRGSPGLKKNFENKRKKYNYKAIAKAAQPFMTSQQVYGINLKREELINIISNVASIRHKT